MKKRSKILVGIDLVILLMAGGLMFLLTRGLEEGKNLAIEDVSFAALEDGIYVGEHDAGRWTNKVEVEIRDGKIVSINLLDGYNHKSIMEEIYSRIIEEQTLKVDVVSGGTVSSNAYIKAIENALKGR